MYYNTSSSDEESDHDHCVLDIPDYLTQIIKEDGVQVYAKMLYCHRCKVKMTNNGAIKSHLEYHLKWERESDPYDYCVLDIPDYLKKFVEEDDVLVLERILYCRKCDVKMINNGAVTSHLRCHMRWERESESSSSDEESDYDYCILDIPDYLIQIIKEDNVQVYTEMLYCHRCKVKMTNNGAIKSHLEDHLKWERESDTYDYCVLDIPDYLKEFVEEDDVVVLERMLYCRDCDVKMINNSAVKSHLECHMRWERESDSSDEEPNYDYCVLDIPDYLIEIIEEDDVLVHEKVLYCKMCKVKMMDNDAIKSHLEDHLKWERLPVSYDYCDLDIPDYLIQVVEEDDIVIFQNMLYCRECDVKMTNKGAIKTHLRRHLN